MVSLALAILPEFIMILAACFIIAGIAVSPTKRDGRFFMAGVVALFTAGVSILLTRHGNYFYNQLYINTYTQAAKAVLFAVTAVLVLVFRRAERNRLLLQPEFVVIIMFAVAAMGLMISANTFLTLFACMQLMNICLYIMAGMNRVSYLSTEAAIKYFILGGLATSMFLLGTSFIYMQTGGLGFSNVQEAVTLNTPLLLEIGLLLVVCAILFKMSAAPFHMWAPDVYQGVPLSVTAFYNVIPKLAMIFLFVRFIFTLNLSSLLNLRSILSYIAMLSLLVGSIMPIVQKELKRLLAYSSIGHMGFVLLCLVNFTPEGAYYAIIYGVIYTALILGVFLIMISLQHQYIRYEKSENHGELFSIGYLKGLAQKRGKHAATVSVLLLALAGLPPFAGFFIKLNVFKILISQEQYVLVTGAVLATLVSCYYYLYLIRCMYFDEPEPNANIINMRIFSYEIAVPIYGLTGFALVLFLVPGLYDKFITFTKNITDTLFV